MQTPPTATQLADARTVYSVGGSDTTIKGYTSVRVGFYGGVWETPVGRFGFPLNSSRTIKYDVEFTPSWNGSAADSMSFCWALTSRTDYDSISQNFTNPSEPVKEVHICPLWRNLVEPQASTHSWTLRGYTGSRVFELYE